MKKFDLKSFAAGLLIGTLGITTAFAAAGILSADLCDTKVTLKGSPLSLNHPLISVTMEDGQEPKLYMPADELLTSLGYTLHYDNGKIQWICFPEMPASRMLSAMGMGIQSLLWPIAQNNEILPNPALSRQRIIKP